MKVKDVIFNTVDNYYNIVVEVFDKNTHLIKKRYKIKPHSIASNDIPDNVMDMEVGMMVIHFDSFIISVMGE